ncbi:cornifelin-like protein [Brachionus plicatilis]|uniref:Cornifelin-like protein n=1 Tax=Brachionus plicatilis TaxID=10195 RepID=A0A3M7PVP9_BRAPC|nr:cornifelin-like protein [Brachionus plicatilis]
MSSVSNQPKSGSFEYSNEFHHDFFDCCADPKNALFAFFCLPIFLCKLQSEAGQCFCTPFFCPQSQFMFRSFIRAHYRIQGALWKDIVATSCCPCCSALQLMAEIKANGDS